MHQVTRPLAPWLKQNYVKKITVMLIAVNCKFMFLNKILDKI